MKKAASFKRRDLFSSSVRHHFFLFAVTTTIVFALFIFEEIKLSIANFFPMDSQMMMTTPDIHKLIFSTDMVVLLVVWLALAIFCFTFIKHRLKPVFRLFSWMLFALPLVFLSWSFIITSLTGADNTKLLQLFMCLDFSFTLKAVVLLLWLTVTIHFATIYVNSKFNAIFKRLDFLFKSIKRGNWDATMFFRTEDPFNFLAATFNKLKEKYLNYMFESDEALIHIKDTLIESDSSSKKEIVKNILDEIKSK